MPPRRLSSVAYGIAASSLMLGLSGQLLDAQTVAYGRYLPLGCAQAVWRAERQFWRDQRPDTIYHPPTGDYLRDSTVSESRSCLARFDVATVPVMQLWSLGAAALAANEDARADSAFQRLMTLGVTKPIEERAWDVYQIVRGALDASPPRVAMALHYVNILDHMKPAAPAERMLAHAALSERAHVLDSIPLLEAEVAAAVAASRELTGDAKKEWAWQAARVAEAHADLAGRRGEGAAAAAILDTAIAQLGPLRRGITEELVGLRFPYTLYGIQSPPVIGSYWYGSASPTVVPALVRPARGIVSLLVFVSQGCSDLCYPGYAVLRRLATTFSDSVLDVTLLTRTGGWYQNRLVANAADEAELVQRYFHREVGLPFPMAVWATEFTRNPDGSLTVVSAPNDFSFAKTLAAPLYAVLVDQAGIVRGTMGVSPANEARLHHMIAVLLGTLTVTH